jgi:hypothetical protein
MRVGVCGSSANSRKEYHLLLWLEEEVAAVVAVDVEVIVCLLRW